MNEETRTAIEQLSSLAMQSEVSNLVNWNILTVPKEELYNTMAQNVIEQMDAVEEEQRAVVAMATMTKLLVENLIFMSMLKGGNVDEN